MAEARAELEWNQTSQVLSMLYNANRGKAPSRKPQDFNPTIKKVRGVDFAEIKRAFHKPKPKPK